MSALAAAVAAALALWGYNGPVVNVEVADLGERYVGWTIRDQHDPNVCTVRFARGWATWVPEYLLLVAIHEVGHCLGYEGEAGEGGGGHSGRHSSDVASVMYGKIWSATEQRILPQDRLALRAARPPLRFRAIAANVGR